MTFPAIRRLLGTGPAAIALPFGTATTRGGNAALHTKLPFDVEVEFVPLAKVLDVSSVLAINPEVINVRTLQKLVTLLKANPGRYSHASTGSGAGTVARFADKLIAAAKAVLEQRELPAQFEARGDAVRIESSEQFCKTVRDSRVKWAEVARSANITLD